MTKAYKMVDFGPLALPVLDEINTLDMHTDKANPIDVEKLNNLLRDKGRGKREALEVEDTNPVPSPSAITSNDKKEIIDFNKLAILICKIAETIATGTAATVTLKVNPSLLPNTTLIAKEIDHGILFEMFIGDELHRKKLIDAITDLAKDLVQRLRCDVKISIFDPIYLDEPVLSHLSICRND